MTLFFYDEIQTGGNLRPSELNNIKKLIENGYDVNKPNDDGMPPLHMAIENNHYDVLKLLINAKANVNSTDHNKDTPLIMASERGELNMVRLLLVAGANINYQNNDKNTALIYASANGHYEIVKKLLSVNANINHLNSKNSSALLYSTIENQEKIVKLLLLKGANVNQQNNHGNTPMMLAANKGYINLVEMFLQMNADTSIKNLQGKTVHDVAKNNEIKDLLKPYIIAPSTKREELDDKQKFINMCKENIDFISQEKWEDVDGTIIQIQWNSDISPDCYTIEDIKQFMKNDRIYAIEWVKNPNTSDDISIEEQNMGRGYYPNPNGSKFIKLWPLDYYVTLKSLKKLLLSSERTFKAKSLGKKRLGNLNGTFGVSELHGQIPFPEVFELI